MRLYWTVAFLHIRSALDLAERTERAVYLGPDEKKIPAKYVAEEKILT